MPFYTCCQIRTRNGVRFLCSLNNSGQPSKETKVDACAAHDPMKNSLNFLRSQRSLVRKEVFLYQREHQAMWISQTHLVP
jgi:hypothetical protein